MRKKKADSVDCLTFGFTMQNILRGVKVRFEASFFPRKWEEFVGII